MGIVVTGARELCEAVETVGAGCRDIVTYAPHTPTLACMHICTTIS